MDTSSPQPNKEEQKVSFEKEVVQPNYVASSSAKRMEED